MSNLPKTKGRRFYQKAILKKLSAKGEYSIVLKEGIGALLLKVLKSNCNFIIVPVFYYKRFLMQITCLFES